MSKAPQTTIQGETFPTMVTFPWIEAGVFYPPPPFPMIGYPLISTTNTYFLAERRPSPNGGMTLDNLASNNPFRQAASPPPQTNAPVQSPTLAPPPAGNDRPMSTTNPFLDSYEPPSMAQRTAAVAEPAQRLFKYDGVNRRQAAITTTDASDNKVCTRYGRRKSRVAYCIQ